jgi:protein-L-isoaspartate(D-aspartate) O-methyltransferase
VRLRARLRQIRPKAREPEQRGGGSEPEKTGAAHAEFSGAPVDPADQAFRQVDIDPLRRIRRVHADDKVGNEVAAPGAAARIVDNARLEAAFSATHREDFLGAGPWWILRWFRDYVTTPDADPVYLYTDDLVGILPERKLNNGQPSLHAHLIHQAAPAAGDHVVHVGTGTGYYTAILAHLAGSSGRVTRIEYEPELAARAKTNFAAYPNVEIVEGDGALVPFDEADVIYINAGCTRPAESWLDRLAEGGRLILPMTSDQGFGAKALERMASAGAVFRI